MRADDLEELLEFYSSGAHSQPSLEAYIRLRQAWHDSGATTKGLCCAPSDSGAYCSRMAGHPDTMHVAGDQMWPVAKVSG